MMQRRLVVSIAIVIVAVGIGVAAWWSSRRPPIPPPTLPSSAPSQTIGTSGQGAATAPSAPTTRPKVLRSDRVVRDQDQDGLLDENEARYGTDPQKGDTDEDGLSDFDEVGIYRTDPKNKDTDGDGFDDRQEIRGGYDPASRSPVQLP